MRDIRSKTFQTVYFISSLLEMFLFAGITFGWASIQIVFKKEGFFSYLCKDEVFNTTNSTFDPSKDTSCPEQNDRFNLVLNVSLVFVCFFQLPVGYFSDKYGPRAGQTVGCLLYITAGLGLAFVTTETSNFLFPIFILFCGGGVFIAYAKFRVSRVLYTSLRSIVLSILSGSFDSSAFVLLIFKIIWEAGIKLRDISLFYTALCLILVSLSAIFLTPPYQELIAEGQRVEPTTTSVVTMSCDDLPKNIIPETFMGSVLSAQFMLELTFLSFCQLRLWYFIGSLDEQIAIQFPTTQETVQKYVTYFTYTQFFGIAVGPITGMIFDRNSIRCRAEENTEEEPLIQSPSMARIKKMRESVLPFFITNFFCVCISLLAMIPRRWTLVLSFICHVITRAFLYASHASFIAIAFRPERFATLNALGIFTAGVFGLLEYPIYWITQKYLRSDPFWINVILLVLVLAASVFPFYLRYLCQKATRSLSTSSSQDRGKRNEDGNETLL